jgi:hypothetical protein
MHKSSRARSSGPSSGLTHTRCPEHVLRQNRDRREQRQHSTKREGASMSEDSLITERPSASTATTAIRQGVVA